MVIIVSNELTNELVNFNTGVIDRINGIYDPNAIVEAYKNKEFDRIIIDITAINNYRDYQTFKVLADGLGADKLLLLLPQADSLITPNYLARLISYGIYNFTTNLDGVNYLLNKPNSYADVEKIDKLSNNDQLDRLQERNSKIDAENPHRKKIIVGFRNVTPSAGATTLIYMLLKELINTYGPEKVVAIEINKSDFEFFHQNNMYAMKSDELLINLQKLYEVPILLIDLNDYPDDSICNEVVYLIEPTTIKMNKVLRSNRDIFIGLKEKCVVLNKSLMANSDLFDLKKETGMNVYYNIPPLDDRKRNPVIVDFSKKIGLIGNDARGASAAATAKIFGLFRR